MAFFLGYRFVEEKYEPLPYFRSSAIIDEMDVAHYQIPFFLFSNQDGQLINNDILKGKIGLINYFFSSCPTICPKMMENLKKLDNAVEIQNQIEILSLTVDPIHDSPKKLNDYSKKHALNKTNWEFLTGKKDKLYQFARHGIFLTAIDGDGGAEDFIHSEKITLIDYDRHIRGYYDGTDADDMKKLLRDIQKLKKMEPHGNKKN